MHNIKNFLNTHDTLPIKKQHQFLLGIVSMCKTELQTIEIDIVGNRLVFFSPIFIHRTFITEFFQGGDYSILSIVHAYIDTHPASLHTEVFSLLSDTVSYIDQLPAENLLDDAEIERHKLLERIARTENSIVKKFSLI